MSNPTDEELLTELATYQNRKLVLWQLAADGRAFSGIRFIIQEHGLNAAPIEKQVQAFADNMLSDGEIRPEYDSMADWDALEANHGDTADQYLST